MIRSRKSLVEQLRHEPVVVAMLPKEYDAFEWRPAAPPGNLQGRQGREHREAREQEALYITLIRAGDARRRRRAARTSR